MTGQTKGNMNTQQKTVTGEGNAPRVIKEQDEYFTESLLNDIKSGKTVLDPRRQAIAMAAIANTQPQTAAHGQNAYCHEIKYTDGDTLSIGSVKSKPRETICKILELKREVAQVAAQRDELIRQIPMSVTRSRMVAGMDKNQARKQAKLEILRLVETDIDATIRAITKAEQH